MHATAQIQPQAHGLQAGITQPGRRPRRQGGSHHVALLQLFAQAVTRQELLVHRGKADNDPAIVRIQGSPAQVAAAQDIFDCILLKRLHGLAVFTADLDGRIFTEHVGQGYQRADDNYAEHEQDLPERISIHQKLELKRSLWCPWA
jgi:hypothetical protein